MARNDIRSIVELRSTANDPDRLVLKKYEPVIRRHVDVREEG